MADPSLHQQFEERLDESLDRRLERIDQAADKAMGTKSTAEIAHDQGREGSAAVKDRFQAEGRPAERAFRALDAGRVDPFEQRATGTEAANMERSGSPHITISEAGRQHLAELEALKADPKALLYRLDPEGGFTVGQLGSGLASYAYPTSEHASHAKSDPATVARIMFEDEWRDRDLRAWGAPAAEAIRERDARLMEGLGNGLTDGTTEAAPRFDAPRPEVDRALESLAAAPFDAVARFPKDAPDREQLLHRLEQEAWKHGGRMDHYPPEPSDQSRAFSVGVSFDNEPAKAAFIADARTTLSDTGAEVVSAEDAKVLDAQERLSWPFDGYPDRDTSHDDSPLPDLDPVKAEAFVQEGRGEERQAARKEIDGPPVAEARSKMEAGKAAMMQDAPMRGAAEPTLPRVFDDPRQMELPADLRALESRSNPTDRQAAIALSRSSLDQTREEQQRHGR